MNEIFAWIFSLLIIEPLQAQITEGLGMIPSVEVTQASQSCLAAEMPKLLQKAGTDWGWTMTTAVGFWMGTVQPVELLSTSNADCQTMTKALADGRASGTGA